MLKSEQKTSEKAGEEEIFNRVRQLVSDDVPVKKACEREGLDRNRYYYLLRTSQALRRNEQEAS